jgi:sugar/nucleoside kinase (ribokinase family)
MYVHVHALAAFSPPTPEFFEVEHIVRTGETISSTSYSRRPGGKGANCATAIAKVSLLFRVVNDHATWSGLELTAVPD